MKSRRLRAATLLIGICTLLSACMIGTAARAQSPRDQRSEVAATTNRSSDYTVSAIVRGPDGWPVADAVVVTSLGGRGITNEAGEATLHLYDARDKERLTVTAVGMINNESAIGTKQVVANYSERAGLRTVNTGVITLQLQSQCDPALLPTFGGEVGVGGNIYCFAVFDDGQGGGPALYVGGAFGTGGGTLANGIAKWDGTKWSQVGEASFANSVSINCMIVYDDGSGTGEQLYVGGYFLSISNQPIKHIARWNGTEWTSVGAEFTQGFVYAMQVFDDGSGPALYIGGNFTTTDENQNEIKDLARWDGVSYSRVGGNTTGEIRAMAVYDGAPEGVPVLYIGGNFTSIGGKNFNRIAKWNGTEMLPVGEGVDHYVMAMTVFDDGTGAQLYVGGWFTNAGELTVNHIASWDGEFWHALGEGTNDRVESLYAYEGGNLGRSALYIGGWFTNAGGLDANTIAKWDGTQWSSLNSGLQGTGQLYTHAMTVFDDGTGDGPVLFVGGDFEEADGVPMNNIAKWDGSSYDYIATGLHDQVTDLAVFDDGSGPALYAAGRFLRIGHDDFFRFAKWDGAQWSAVGPSLDFGLIYHLTVADDGSGPALYVCGNFTFIGGVPINRVAKWDGKSFTQVGNGFDNGTVHTLTTYDDGTGEAIYVGGSFDSAQGVELENIGKLVDGEWLPLAGGVNSTVYDLAVYDAGLGDGPELIVGGNFTRADGDKIRGIAKWNGTEWSRVGFLNRRVYSLIVIDDFNDPGQLLIAGGDFEEEGDNGKASGIARWDGTTWTALGSGLVSGNGPVQVTAMTMFDDGTGLVLYASGWFIEADGLPVDHIAKWDGTNWHPLGASDLGGRVSATVVYDDGSGLGPALYIGGQFRYSSSGDSFLARWQGCANGAFLPANLVDFTLTFGTLLNGGLDQLTDDDNDPLVARSKIGFSAVEPNILQLRVGAETAIDDPSALRLSIQSRLNTPGGTARARLRNWQSGTFEELHLYNVGTTEVTEIIEVVDDAGRFVRDGDGRVELAHHQVVVATFSAIGFDCFFDWVGVEVK